MSKVPSNVNIQDSMKSDYFQNSLERKSLHSALDIYAKTL